MGWIGLVMPPSGMGDEDIFCPLQLAPSFSLFRDVEEWRTIFALNVPFAFFMIDKGSTMAFSEKRSFGKTLIWLKLISFSLGSGVNKGFNFYYISKMGLLVRLANMGRVHLNAMASIWVSDVPWAPRKNDGVVTCFFKISWFEIIYLLLFFKLYIHIIFFDFFLIFLDHEYVYFQLIFYIFFT